MTPVKINNLKGGKAPTLNSMSMYQKISYYLNYFNGNKFIVGLVILIMNVGSKYAVIELVKAKRILKAYLKTSSHIHDSLAHDTRCHNIYTKQPLL